MVKSRPDLVWERMESARPSRKLGYDQIVAAAMELADSQGLMAVSMRNVAACLDAGTMSLYRYVASKDELLDLILDAAYGEIDVPEKPSGYWRKDIEQVAKATRKVMRGHPWLAPLLTMRPTMGPRYLRWFEFLLAVTARPGASIRTRARMIGTVWAYVAGFVSYELGEMETNRRNNLTESKKRELAAPYVEKIIATGRFPNLERFVAAEISEPTDNDFEFGLTVVLAGLASRT